MNKTTRVVHPILFAIFPVVFLYSHNAGEVFLSQTVIPFVVCLAGGILLWSIIFAVLRNKLKSAILTSLMLVYFFSYGHMFSLIKGCYIGSWKIGIHTYILPFWALTFGLPLVLVFMTKRNLDVFTKILNVIAVCLVVISIGNIAIFHFKLIARTQTVQLPGQDDENEGVDVSKLKTMPNIYYIILDGHARDDILKEEFSHDSSPFISHLKDKGFFVSQNSRSNYMNTSLSIPSSLNFRYFDDLEGIVQLAWVDLKYVRNIIVNNRVFSFLKEIGYSTISFSSPANYCNINNADHYLSRESTANAFANELLNSTPLMALQKVSIGVHRKHYKMLNYTFDGLAEAAKMPSPHIVFAHILCPHAPYVFDENGGFTKQFGIFGLDKSHPDISERKRRYLAQLKYVEKRIARTVDAILANSMQKPIIILQADHGIRWLLKDDPDKSGITSRIDCFAILNALHLPGFDYSKLDNNITPVNTFRIIFNHYFGMDFDILENKSFILGRPPDYKFRDVTESLNERKTETD